MVSAVLVPRFNTNEDEAIVVAIKVAEGQRVSRGQPLFELETSKAIGEVCAERDGLLLKIVVEEGECVPVRGILAWIGDEIGESVPEQKNGISGPREAAAEPTLGALKLLEEHRLAPDDLKPRGGRLRAEDVREFLEGNGPAYERMPLTRFQRAMTATVSWSKAEPVTAYMEMTIDHAPWEEHGEELRERHGLMANPMLGLMAHRLVRIAGEMPEINGAFDDGAFRRYSCVNLGFTVDIKGRLYLIVVERADELSDLQFVERLAAIQRRAFGKRLSFSETVGATLSFTSLAKAGVTRHVPVLPPRTSLIVAHSAVLPMAGDASLKMPMVLGASYDHRVLDGAIVSRVLGRMASPGDEE
jgi:pyruvate dehydrogenase E2 component (dihydrolipoamide acetyltransferase)